LKVLYLIECMNTDCGTLPGHAVAVSFVNVRFITLALCD
jgi:hypothetical protein